MSNTKFKLNKIYRYDVVFDDKTVGQLVLSPSGIILKKFNQVHSENLKNDYFDIISCKTIEGGIDITLLEIMPLNMSGHIDIIERTLYSNDTYSCKSAIIGKSFKNISDIQITNISIIYDSLRQWYYSGVNSNIDFRNNIITYQIPLNQEMLNISSIDEFNFSIACRNSYSASAHEDVIPKPEYSINFDFDKNKNFSDLLEYLYKWQVLYSIFLGQIELPQALTFKDNNTFQELSYYYPIFNTSKKLHYMQIPIRYNMISQNFEIILNKWFKMEDNDRQNIVYLYESIDETKSITERFLSSFKLVEGIVGKGKDTFFKENELNDIKNAIRTYCSKNLPNKNDLEEFLLKLDYTNEHKLDTQDDIANYVIQNKEDNFINLEKGLISDLVKYRNTISHNNSFSKNEEIDYNKVNEGYLKFVILGYLYFLRKYEITYTYLSIALLSWSQILRNKSKLSNEIIIELPAIFNNNEKIENLRKQYKSLNIRFISPNPQNLAKGYDSIIFINLINDKLEKNVPSFIQKFIKVLSETGFKKGIYYIDGLNHIITELPDLNKLEAKEFSDCLKDLFDILDKKTGCIDSYRLIVYDTEKRQWDYKATKN